jgi:hypothetical protein
MRGQDGGTTRVAVKKWQVLEGIAAAIERSLAEVLGTKVVLNAAVPMRGSARTRQVDVLVEIPTGIRRLRVGVEVKDQRAPLDVTQVDQLAAKLAKLEVDRGCVVAASGFTSEVREEALRYGLETRTIVEVSIPDWWLPRAMPMVRRQVELLHYRLNYAAELLEQAKLSLTGVDPASILVVTPNESPVVLPILVANQGLVAVEQFERGELTDQLQFSMQLRLSLPFGSALTFPGGSLSLPESIDALYRLHVSIESVPLTAYQMGDTIEVLGGVTTHQKSQQLTVVVQQTAEGTRQLTMSLTDAAPKPTRVQGAGESPRELG